MRTALAIQSKQSVWRISRVVLIDKKNISLDLIWAAFWVFYL